MYNNKLSTWQRNGKTIFCAVEDASGAMDLTGWTGTLHLSNAGRDEPPFLSREAYFVDASTGTLAFSLVPEDTSVAAGDYVYEIRIDSSSDSRTVVYDRLKILDSLV